MVYYIPAEQGWNCLSILEEGSIFSPLLMFSPYFDVKSHWGMKSLSTFFAFTIPVEHKKDTFSLHYLGWNKEWVWTGNFPNVRISFGGGRGSFLLWPSALDSIVLFLVPRGIKSQFAVLAALSLCLTSCLLSCLKRTFISCYCIWQLLSCIIRSSFVWLVYTQLLSCLILVVHDSAGVSGKRRLQQFLNCTTLKYTVRFLALMTTLAQHSASSFGFEKPWVGYQLMTRTI